MIKTEVINMHHTEHNRGMSRVKILKSGQELNKKFKAKRKISGNI